MNEFRPGRRSGGQSRRILVMGAGNGVGLACARALSDPSTDLFIADIDAPALQRANRDLGATAMFCDVASEASVAIFAADLERLAGSLDVLINAAGPSYVRTLGTMRICRVLLPLMRRETGSKDVINIAQLAPLPDNCPFPYAASTKAFVSLSEALSDQLRGSSVRLTTVLPRQLRDGAELPEVLHRGASNRRLYVDQSDPGALAARIAHYIGHTAPVMGHSIKRAAGGWRC